MKEITLQAGETVLLKAKNGAAITEIKKPKRNTAKEREWEKKKYHRFTFLVDKEKAKLFMDCLDGIRPLDWFREAIEEFTNLSIDNATEKNTLNENNNTFNVEERESSLEKPSSADTDFNPKNKPVITKEIIKKWDDMYDNGYGMNFAEIARSPEALGYDRTTIYRRVTKYRKDISDKLKD